MTSSGGHPEANAARIGDLAVMAAVDGATPHVRLIVKLVRDTEPASGWIESGSGERHEFASLVELMSLVESARLPTAASLENTTGEQ